jgi:hypothetical protein
MLGYDFYYNYLENLCQLAFNIFVGTGILHNCEDCATEIDKTNVWNVERDKFYKKMNCYIY